MAFGCVCLIRFLTLDSAPAKVSGKGRGDVVQSTLPAGLWLGEGAAWGDCVRENGIGVEVGLSSRNPRLPASLCPRRSGSCAEPTQRWMMLSAPGSHLPGPTPPNPKARNEGRLPRSPQLVPFVQESGAFLSGIPISDTQCDEWKSVTCRGTSMCRNLDVRLRCVRKT